MCPLQASLLLSYTTNITFENQSPISKCNSPLHNYTSTAQHIGKYQILPNTAQFNYACPAAAQFNYACPATAQFNYACPATAQFNYACPAAAQFKLCMPCYSTVQLTYITFFFMSATLISFRRNSLMASRSLTS